MEEMTQRIASAGYLGVSPDLYHRDPADCQDDAPTRRARLRDVTVILARTAPARSRRTLPNLRGLCSCRPCRGSARPIWSSM